MVRILDRSVLLSIGLVTAVLLVNAAIAYRNTWQLREDAGWVAHTHEVLDLTGDVLLALVDAETGERGFLLTGREEYLQPYEAALPRLHARLAALKASTVDNLPQQERIAKLERLTAERLALLQQRIEHRRTRTPDPDALLAAQNGKEQMDAIRTLVAVMEQTERDALQVREDRFRTAYGVAVTTGLLTAFVGLSMVGAFTVLLRRSLRARAQAATLLGEQREWLRTTLASIGDAVIAADRRGRVVLLNAVAESLTGWTQRDGDHQPLMQVFRVVDEETRLPLPPLLDGAVRNGQARELAQPMRLVARDGTERPITANAAPIVDARGKSAGVVLVFRDDTKRRQAERERQQLLEREQAARAQAEAARERLAFLAEASAVLSSSLDYEAMLETVARLAVTRLADWCSIDLLGEQGTTLQRVAVVHKEPSKVQLAKELRLRYPPDPTSSSGVFTVVRTGRSELIAEVPEALLERAARDAEHLRLLRGLGLQSAMIVPLVAREVVLGVLIFASERPQRRFDTNDLSLAEDLARRCAAAIDNSRLYQQAQEKVAEHRQMEEQLTLLVEASGALTSTLEPTAVLASILRLSQRLLPADAHGIWRYSPRGNEWRIVSASGLSERYQEATIALLGQTPTMPDRPVVADDVFALPLLAERRAAYEAEGIRSLVALPLRIHGQLCGTLTVYHRQLHHFAETEVRLASALANLAATALGSADLYEEQARLHAEAHEQKEWFRITLSSIGDAVIATDTAGQVMFLNPVATALTGWSQEEAQGKPLETVFAVIHEKTRQPVENPATRALREGAIVGLANHALLCSKDGQERPIEDSAAPIINQRGVLGVVLVFRDVTARRRAEQILRESEERLRLALEAGHMGVWDWHLQTNRLTWTEELEAMHGLASGTFAGTLDAFLQRVHPEDRAEVEQTMARSLEGGTHYDLEFRQVWPDGSVRWMASKGKVLREGNVPTRMVSVSLDITKRKRAEEDMRFLAEASATLAALVDYESTLQKVARLAVPIFADWCTVDMLDEDGSLRRLAVAHVDPSKLELARQLHERFPPNPQSPYGIWQILRTGQPEMVVDFSEELLTVMVKNVELRNCLRELGLRSYMSVPLAVRGQVLGVITFVAAESGRRYDAADLAVAEELAHRAAVAIENARLYQAVRDADRRKDEFLAVLAHELRNPLAPIRNALEVLRLAGPNAELAGQARAMAERQIEALTRLVDDLLDVSRIMRGKIELRPERIDIATVVGRAVETARPTIDAQGHALEVNLPERPVWIEADVVRIAQVIANLLNNAAKYTERGGRITLEVQQDGEQAMLRVRDTGIGIVPEMRQRIFDLFMQVGTAGVQSKGGLGIGLTVVRNLVEMHGGTVEAHSAGLGQGSEFVVRLPLAEPHAEPEAAQPSPGYDSAVRRTGRKVLVVDDNYDAADSLAMLMRLTGQEVQVAYDGPSALAKAAVDPPALAFLDLGMPKMSGYALAQAFRADPLLKDTVLVALTGWGQPQDRQRTKEAGFNYHLVKPVEPAALKRLLAERL